MKIKQGLYFLIKYFILSFILFEDKYIKSFILYEKYPYSLLLSNNDLFLVTQDGFRLYDSNLNILKNCYNFTDDEKITSDNIIDTTCMIQFSNSQILAFVNSHFYFFNEDGELSYKFEEKKGLLQSYTDKYYYSLFPQKASGKKYHFFISYNNKQAICINYYSLKMGTINLMASYENEPTNSEGNIGSVASYGISCNLMTKDTQEVIACFYEMNYPQELAVNLFTTTSSSINEISNGKFFISNSGASIIKSVISSDRKIALICYSKDYQSTYCLHYNIDTNEFSSEVQYFTSCKGRSTGLYLYYFEKKDEYMFICQKDPNYFNVVLFNSNFEAHIVHSDEGKTEPFYKFGGDCYKINNFNIIYLDSTDEYIMVNDCNYKDSNFLIGNFSLERLSEDNNLPIKISHPEVEVNNNTDVTINTIVNKNGIYILSLLNKTLNEVLNNLDDLIKDKDPNKTYILNGKDYSAIIKPVDKYVEESTVNIDFSECEKKLKEKNSSKAFRMMQVNMENKNENCLTDQVEYKIYDELGNGIDLSVCENVDINIEYKIKNISLLNLEDILNFKDQGVDIFNINNDFFNDICYSYSDSNSSSDMILNDRVADIYQNFSICGEGCEYESFDIEKLASNCNCKVKQEVSTEMDEGNFQTYIESSFLDSNFGVVKCYNLVFSLKGKLKNAGFWIFAIMIFFHIPIYIFYFIKGIKPLLNYLNIEMNKNGYSLKSKNHFSKRIQSTNQDINESKNNPPKKQPHASSTNLGHIIKHEVNHNYIKMKSSNNITRNINHQNLLIRENNNLKPNPGVKFTIRIVNKLNDNNISINERKNNNKNKYLNTIETNMDNQININYEKNKEYNDELDIDLNEEMYINKKYSKKNFKKFNRIKKKNTISEVGSGEILASSNEYHKKLSKKNKLNKSFDNKINTKEIDKKELEYPLILISANNKKGDDALKSNYIINNYDFDEAVYYEKRSFCRIFYIFLISKENNLNIILVNLPLELKPIRICVFIFSYACDFALNALFYLSDNISDKYHYSGAYRELFSLVNNIIISIVSAVVSFLLLTFFQTLTQSTSKIEAIFRKQELLLKTDKNYKVTEHTKMEIQKKIDSIMKCLKIKIICFIIMELLFMLFFFYYVTAFCQVYHSTQVSWLLDFLSSFVFSLLVTIVICFICALCYRVSIKYKLKILYKITTFICSS